MTISWEELKAQWAERDNATGLLGVRHDVVDWYHRCSHKVRIAPSRVRWAWQRVVRGWDDRSVHSLDVYLALTLGEQLIELAEHGHGYPGDYPYERWTRDLHRHGEALICYSEGWFDTWETVYEPAREALVWVADNLGSLWD